MNYQDLKALQEATQFEAIEGVAFSEVAGNRCAVNGRIALPLTAVSTVYARDEDIKIEDEDGQLIGILCFCKDEDLNLSTITDDKYVAYIEEVEKDNYMQPYRFKNDYLVLQSSRFNDYFNKYMHTSALWGGFIHSILPIKLPYKVKKQKIVAVQLEIPSEHHEENCIRSVLQPYAFERFLKLYHLLELLFDHDLVTKINSLGKDLKGIGQIFSDYERGEYERLKMIISTRCQDVDSILVALNGLYKSNEYIKKAKTIFFEFGKDKNPFKDNESAFDELIRLGLISEENAKATGLISKRPNQSGSQFKKLIIETATYWIYRVRCSIAHNRIGEYIMSHDDEEFMAEFAEPLLREIVCQSFRKSEVVSV